MYLPGERKSGVGFSLESLHDEHHFSVCYETLINIDHLLEMKSQLTMDEDSSTNLYLLYDYCLYEKLVLLPR